MQSCHLPNVNLAITFTAIINACFYLFALVKIHSSEGYGGLFNHTSRDLSERSEFTLGNCLRANNYNGDIECLE